MAARINEIGCKTETTSNDASSDLERNNHHINSKDDENEEIGDLEEDYIPKMGGGRPYPPKVGHPADYIVLFEGQDDPTNPQNFSFRRKLPLIIAIMTSCFTSTYGSAVLSEAILEILEKFHVGLEVSTLCTSLFVLGYASGPVLWGPLSDVFGRKIVLVPTTFIYLVLNFAVATAKDIQTIILCRFFSGFVSAAPMVIVAAILAEISNNRNRATLITYFAMILFSGPMLAPIINGFIVKNYSLGWRWCAYIMGIMCSITLALLIFFYEETHNGVILSRKAQILRKETGNWSIFAGHEDFSPSFDNIVMKAIGLPIRMLFSEPILLSITIYNSFIFGLLYLLLTAIPIIFGQSGYGFSQGVSLLPYIAVIMGVEVGGFVNILFEKRYRRILKTAGRLVPEERLVPMMIGAVIFPCGLFWLAWSGQYHEDVHWIIPTIGTFPIGFGLICIFLPSLTYLIECYLPYTASAVAGNTMIRYAFGAAFPLFARQMFDKLGVDWGGSLLGFISILLLPAPFLFYKYGERLRNRSKYCLKT